MTQEDNRLTTLRRLLAKGHLSQAEFDALAAGLTGGPTETAQGDGAKALGSGAVNIDGDGRDVITGQQINAQGNVSATYVGDGATLILGSEGIAMSAVDADSARGQYLKHLISQNRSLQLQGIRSGGKLVNIELDRIYITLCTRPAQRSDEEWLALATTDAPGETQRLRTERRLEGAHDPENVTVNDALAQHRRLVVLGDPGSGKTTLLRYLTLLYAQDQADDSTRVQDRLALSERALPLFLPLRQVGRYLAEHQPQDDGTEGHRLLLDFYRRALANERIGVPEAFFDDALSSGDAIVLLDGLDEVADAHLRRRVARLVDALVRAHPDCRYVVSSRIVGYTEASQLAEAFTTTTVRDFTEADIHTFLRQWHRLVAASQMGVGAPADTYAQEQTRQLLAAMEANERVRELAINPLMLTVIALVHRDRVRLPDRRAELYDEAIDVLLGKWDDARGVPDAPILPDGRPFDAKDRRLVLQQIALAMHEDNAKEIEAEPLRDLLKAQLRDAVEDPRRLDAAADRFVDVINERSGLLIARGEGTFAFSHLTFQEYLAALALAGRDDYVEATLAHADDAWWREVILLEAGYLSTQSKEKTTRLIREIADRKPEPEPYHNLVLAAECVRDAGASRVLGELERELRARLESELARPTGGSGWVGTAMLAVTRGMTPRQATQRRIAAAEALGKIGGQRFWSMPYGEPDWIEVPAGPFTMGEDAEAHTVHLPAFSIAPVPVTNLQYQLFVQATGHKKPEHWVDGRLPRGKEHHPVVYVSWHDSLAYCRWLCQMTGRPVTLPSEAEWEKAARGTDDARPYPWGDSVNPLLCNTRTSAFGQTTPVGIFDQGASPFGCLDMAGNVWEWSRSLWGDWRKPARYRYPYRANDARREDLKASNDVARVVRGGAFGDNPVHVRCAFRDGSRPDDRYVDVGFRVVLSGAPVRSDI